MTPKTILDSDVLSAVMRKQPTAFARAQAYLGDHARLTFSLVTHFEILRGLKVKTATTQLNAFQRLCTTSEVLPITEAVIERAAGIYADLHQRGELISDADILIAANALEHGLAMATNNERHFLRVTGLTVDNWLK